MTTDLSAKRIAAAAGQIDPVFRDTPQFVSQQLSARFEREVVVKVETLNPIGSFKGRGTSLLAQQLDPTRTWVCSTAGNFGQGLAYSARGRGAAVHAFVSPAVPRAKVATMRSLDARVEVSSPRRCARCWGRGRTRALMPPRAMTDSSSSTGCIRRSRRARVRSALNSERQIRSTRPSCNSVTAPSFRASHAGSSPLRPRSESSACAPAELPRWPRASSPAA